MQGQVPPHREKLSNFIDEIKAKEEIQDVLRSGDRDQIIPLLEERDFSPDDLAKLEEDLKVLGSIPADLVFWRFGGVAAT